MSRFRPDRRRDDHHAGDPSDGHDYAGDAYEEGPYRDDAVRGGYPAPGDSDAGGRPPSDAGRAAQAAHGPRFRQRNDVLQPTSVISPGGLVGGPPPEDQRDYDQGERRFGAGPPGYPPAPPPPPQAGYAYPPGYDQPGYDQPGYDQQAGYGAAPYPDYGLPHPDYGPAHGVSAGYEAGAAYPPGPDSETDLDDGGADGYGPLPPYAAPPEYRPAPAGYYPPSGPGYHQEPAPTGYYPQDGYQPAGYTGQEPYDQGYTYGVSDGEEFVPRSGSSGSPAPGPGAPWGGLLATGPIPATTGGPGPSGYEGDRGQYHDVAAEPDPRPPGPVPPPGYSRPPGYPPPGYPPPGYPPPGYPAASGYAPEPDYEPPGYRPLPPPAYPPGYGPPGRGYRPADYQEPGPRYQPPGQNGYGPRPATYRRHDSRAPYAEPVRPARYGHDDAGYPGVTGFRDRAPGGYGPRGNDGYGAPGDAYGYGRPDDGPDYGEREPAGYGAGEPARYDGREGADYGDRQSADYGPPEPARYRRRQPADYADRDRPAYAGAAGPAGPADAGTPPAPYLTAASHPASADGYPASAESYPASQDGYPAAPDGYPDAPAPPVYRDPGEPGGYGPPAYREPPEPPDPAAPAGAPAGPAEAPVPVQTATATAPAPEPAVYFSTPDKPATPAPLDEPGELARVAAAANPDSPAPEAAGPAPVLPLDQVAARPGRDEPEPYVAPDDPNTGARTEPFRGPFEPPAGQPKLSDFVPSSPEPGDPEPPGPAAPTGSRPTLTAARAGGGAPLTVPAGGAPEDRGASEEKLEKIKDLYLTVEAIGDDNVGKHFDELMTRQRELISDYFKETGIGNSPGSATQPDQPG